MNKVKFEINYSDNKQLKKVLFDSFFKLISPKRVARKKI